MSSGQAKAMPDLQKLQQDLNDVREEVRNLTVMSMWPNLLPTELVLVKNLLRSARAEARIRLALLREQEKA
jgi:hypothetical protein